jgi:hypothetical protein
MCGVADDRIPFGARGHGQGGNDEDSLQTARILPQGWTRDESRPIFRVSWEADALRNARSSI